MFLRLLKIINWILTKQRNPAIIHEPTQQNNDMESLIDPVNHIRDWAIEKINLLHEADRHKNAKALHEEFSEWIDIPEGNNEINYICLENEDWTNEREIDVL